MVSIYFAAIYPLPGGHASFLRGKREAREPRRATQKEATPVKLAVEKQRKWGKILKKDLYVSSVITQRCMENRSLSQWLVRSLERS